MNIENKIFENYLPIFEQFKDYGFCTEQRGYKITKLFIDNEFNAQICISKDGCVRGKVYDFDGQEYIPLRVEGLNGAFIGQVRNEYENILLDIREKCFIHKSKIKQHKEWLIPANPKVFDIDEGFRNTPELEWHQFGNVNKGDTVYIYMAASISAILYKCEVVKANLPPNLNYPTSKPHKTMYLKLIKKYDKNLITREFMKQYGVGAVRGFRSMPEKLSKVIQNF